MLGLPGRTARSGKLSASSSPDSAIGQLTRYMGWVQMSIANGQPVHGVIVARLITDRLKYAVRVIPNVSLFEYQIQFDLKPVA
jgi:RecB family endonuclease NucS